jgi:extradiol dioxygenase family protein
VTPILHLSIPVRDLAEARAFYVDLLGCRPGRWRDDWGDVWFYGLQLTLHERPEQVSAEPGVRHFGVTLPGPELAALLARLDHEPLVWARPVQTDHAGTGREQTKAMVLDPSGNAIELKTYVDPEVAFAS